MMKKKARKKGFTLVEVLVVLAIVALLAATAIPKVKGIYDEAQLEKAKADAMQIAAAIQRVELKNELAGSEDDLFSDHVVLASADFEALKIQISSSQHIFRYHVITEQGNIISRRIQVFLSSDTEFTKLLGEVIIPE